ncbi:hypothetical protein HMPREF3185_00197 [Porphyromonas somerae]|uniref:Uncharacterized protein n=1 Tax=Porphyromonas somerae TaxID=322095 RepID=A0A134BEI2_9PORP|nr:hypothetical protein HMPREF3184_00197 [Porphyromonadaceae bacterium KA00676]KXB78319.1 hypothetical protein HMPREF3185_00197 [Porphyromonas somerae]
MKHTQVQRRALAENQILVHTLLPPLVDLLSTTHHSKAKELTIVIYARINGGL